MMNQLQINRKFLTRLPGGIRVTVVLILLFQAILLSAHPLQQTITRIVSVAWSPDGTKLAISGGPPVCDNIDLSLYDVKIINPVTNQTLLNITGNRCYVGDLSWSPDNSKLMGTTIGGVHIWNALTGQSVLNNIRGQGFVSARWMPDGNSLIVTDSSGGMLILNANTGQLILVLDVLGSVIDLNSSGTRLVAGKFRENVLRILDTANGQLVLSLSGHSAGVSSVDWSPDGSKIASGSDNGNVRVWNATSGGQLLSLSAHTGTVTSVAWNPDNRLLATTGVDGNLRIWDTTNGQLVSQISAVGFIYDAAWSPDGNKLAYGGASSTVNLIAPSNSGRGLRGAYYDNADFTALRYFRLNPTVNFIWRDFSPDPALIPVIGADTFSVRWTGKVEPLYSEAYTFYVTHDDGVRLWVNGQQIINNWTNQASSVTSSGTITLAAGVKYDIRLDYYENTFLAEVRLDWQSARQARQVIPASQLYPPEGQLAFNGITAAIGEIYVRNPDGTGEINLSNHAAADINPIWSPDGARVAWVSSRDGNQDIYLANVDGSGLRRLTNNTLIDAEPAWSPDGTKIIFRSTRSGGGDLYTMDVMGTGVPTPTRFTSSTLNDYDPMWSPNGKFVAYTVDTGGSTGPELYLLAVASNGLSPSGSPIRLTNRNGNDVTAFWSPDGSLIAFRAPYGSGGIGDQIWTVRTSSPYTLTRLTTQGNNNFQSWSPDSSKILFQSTRDGNQEIYTMNADGSGQTRLTNSSVAETYAVWSADARQIAYNRGNDIWLMNADGSNARNWTNTPARAEIEIVWWQVKQSR